MSREFIDAIASGNNLEAEDEFKSSISSKVGDSLEIRRKEISQTFAGNNEVVEEEAKPYIKQKPDGTWCVYDAEGNIVSEHESEDEAKAALPNKKDDEDDEVEEGLMARRWRPQAAKRELARRKEYAAKGAELAKSGIGSKPSRMSPGAMGGDEDTPAKWDARIAANRKSGKLDDFTGKAKEKIMSRKTKKPSTGPSTDDGHGGR